MFDTVRNNKRIVQGFLALITLPFAFWGVESYIKNASLGVEVATVGDSKISMQEFQTALREQGERMQQQMGAQFDPRMLESPEVKQAVTTSLINQHLLAITAKDQRLLVSDEALATFISQVPALQEDGKFSPDRYQALVASRDMSKEIFEARLRQDMAMQQLVQPIGDASVVSKTAAGRWANVQLEQRAVAEVRLAPDAYVKQVKLDVDAEEKFYQSNKAKFELPEQVKVEYVVLDQDALQKQIMIPDADVESRYKAHPERYTQAESRRASHILLTLPKDAKEADVKAAQVKANELLAQVKANPKAFPELARKHSQDPGSAQKGGDLDWFGRGMMVKAFEDTVFSLKQDEISGVVRSDFGLHIIRVTGIRPEHVTPLADVKGDILTEIKRELATRKFAEAAESFNNLVYEQADTLKPAAEQWKLPVQASDWLRKGDRLPPPFDNVKLQGAIFGADAVSKKQNTASIEIAPGKLLSARVLDHQPATVQALDAVKPAITHFLTQEKANELAIADGELQLAKTQKGEATDLKWGGVRQILRAAPRGLAIDAARNIFAVSAEQLPAYVGAKSVEGGYTLYKIASITPAAKDDPRSAMLVQQYARLTAEEEFGAWLLAQRAHRDIKINDKALDSKDR